MTFAEIEELLAQPLPRSSRRWAANWYSDAGSRPGRAIRDAGFRVRELDLVDERVVLERDSDTGIQKGAHEPLASSPVLAAPLPVEDAKQELGTVPDLLREYARLMRTLHDRGVLQTSNNPVSDYAEGLVARAFDLERTTGSARRFDARDPRSGRRLQGSKRLPPSCGRCSLIYSAARQSRCRAGSRLGIVS